MNEYIKYFDNLDQSEGYEIREVPFSGYIKEPHLAFFSKLYGTIKQGKISYDRYIFYTTDNQEIANPDHYDFGANLVENTYTNGQGMMVFDGNVTSIGNYAFSECSSLTTIAIPESVTSIGWNAFYNCSSLTSVTIPNNVTSVGSFAFADCPSLTSVTIGNSVTNIEESTFYNCSSLTSITIPNSVISIGNYVFGGCSALTSITIPDSVTSIGEWVFFECSSLTSITCEAVTPPTLDSGNDLSSITVVYVPAESVEAYKTATNWSYYSNIIQPIQ